MTGKRLEDKLNLGDGLEQYNHKKGETISIPPALAILSELYPYTKIILKDSKGNVIKDGNDINTISSAEEKTEIISSEDEEIETETEFQEMIKAEIIDFSTRPKITTHILNRMSYFSLDFALGEFQEGYALGNGSLENILELTKTINETYLKGVTIQPTIENMKRFYEHLDANIDFLTICVKTDESLDEEEQEIVDNEIDKILKQLQSTANMYIQHLNEYEETQHYINQIITTVSTIHLTAYFNAATEERKNAIRHLERAEYILNSKILLQEEELNEDLFLRNKSLTPTQKGLRSRVLLYASELKNDSVEKEGLITYAHYLAEEALLEDLAEENRIQETIMNEYLSTTKYGMALKGIEQYNEVEILQQRSIETLEYIQQKISGYDISDFINSIARINISNFYDELEGFMGLDDYNEEEDIL